MNKPARNATTAETGLDTPDVPAPTGDAETRLAAIRKGVADQSSTATREPNAKEFREQQKQRNGE